MKPCNIIFILSDDHGQWAIGASGNKEIETPFIDKLANEGVMFNNFFCASPVCSPARATLMTGKNPSLHGVHDWLAAGDTIAKYEPARGGILLEYLKEHPGYTDILHNAGYRCGISGKWHIGDSHHTQKSFEFWRVHAKGGSSYYNAPMIKDGELYEEPKYVTDAITDAALEWLDICAKDEKPFYLSVHYTAPHSPWDRDNHPYDLYDDYYNNCPFNSVPPFSAVTSPPEWAEKIRIPVKDEKQRRVYLSGYYTAVTAMDRNIGRLIKYLEKNNLRENTLIIFSGDNGMNMGHHGIFGKGNATYPMNMFEESVKVPFIVSHPGIIPNGKSASALVSQYDFFPTILEYIGLDIPSEFSSLPGKSFADIMKNPEKDNHEHIVVFDEYGPVRMIRTSEWKYIHRYNCGPSELYNLKEDPGETCSLAGNPEFAHIEKEMKERLYEWFREYSNPETDGSLLPVTGMGQLGMCSETLKKGLFAQG